MNIIYQTKIISIGEFAREALQERMLITFKPDVPADLADYCFIHCHDQLKSAVKIGDILQIDQHTYPITAVGCVANENLRSLGHITLRFDGADQAEYPGTVHIQGDVPEIKINSVLTIMQL